MSSALYNAVTSVLTGDNWLTWSSDMESYLCSQGQWEYITDVKPVSTTPTAPTSEEKKEQKEWNLGDSKAIGNIRLRLSPAIRELMKDEMTSAKDLWEKLTETYDLKGMGAVFGDFAEIMKIVIPAKGNPQSALDEIAMHFSRMDDATIGLHTHLEAMIVISKLPQRYSQIRRQYAQLGATELKKLTLSMVRAAIMNDFSGDAVDQTKKQHSGNANKLTNVRRKQGDPNFQQQQQSGNDGNGDNKKKRKRGSGKNKKNKKHAHTADHETQSLDFSPVNGIFDFTIPAARSDLDPSAPDVHKHSIHPAHRPSTQSLHIHKKTKQAIGIAHALDVHATSETIRTLESHGHISEIDSDDEDTSGPAKRVRTGDTPLAKRISSGSSLMERFDWSEDVVNGITAATPPPPSPPSAFMTYEDFGILPRTPELPPSFDNETPVSLGDESEMMNLDD